MKNFPALKILGTKNFLNSISLDLSLDMAGKKRTGTAGKNKAKKQKVEKGEEPKEEPKDEIDEKELPTESPERESEPGKTEESAGKKLRIVSWNVASLNAAVKKDFIKSMVGIDADVICLQETKTSLKNPPPSAIAEKMKKWKYRYYNNSTAKTGYSGVGLLSKIKPISVQNGMGKKKHDEEGRSITAEFEKFYLVTTYVPNSGRKLERLDYRCQEWETDFREYLIKLGEKKPVILCGDLNVAHSAIDLKNDKANYNKTSGYTQREIDELDKLLEVGFVDSYRQLYPDAETYTFWSYMGGARAKNVGWRLDYFLLQGETEKWLEDNVVHSDIMGSDHCPIELVLNMA